MSTSYDCTSRQPYSGTPCANNHWQPSPMRLRDGPAGWTSIQIEIDGPRSRHLDEEAWTNKRQNLTAP